LISLMKPALTTLQISNVIRLAWEDRTTFEEIQTQMGLVEHEVITIMRRELKPSSFRMWRKRVSSRVTKHRRLMEVRMAGPATEDDSDSF